MLTDLLFVYKISISELIKIPRRFRRLMLDHIPRIVAQQQIVDAVVAQYPTLSEESKKEQMGIWRSISGLLEKARSAAEQILWEGTLPEYIPEGMVVAEDWETVSDFFFGSKSPLKI